MIIVAIVVIGIVAVRGIPVSLMPNVDIPQITVKVDMPGSSVEEIEQQVVAPLREQLSQVAGLKSLSSDARMDGGNILLNFEPGSNINLLFIDVNEKIDMAMPQLPKDMNRPKVVKASATDIPAFYLDVAFKNEKKGEQAGNRFAGLSEFVRNVVAKRIEQLPSTAMVDISGVTSSEIVCVPDENKMTALGITEEDLQHAISDNNIQLEALTIADGIYRYNIHFDSQILTIDDIKNIIVRHEDRLFQLRDICTIEERPALRNGIIRHDGRNSVSLAVIKQSDARMGDLKEAISGVVRDLEKAYPEMQFSITRDQTELLSYSINNLEWNLLAAAAFTFLVLLAFMRRWRLAILVALSIPLSLIITFICFNVIGISMNIISLSGLIIGVGMIVDNSIIVIDNILQKWRDGMKLENAIAQGACEVFTPMLSSVLTTCSVFVPLIFLSGIAGALFFDQSMGITISLFASLAVAMLVLPVYFYMNYRKAAEAPADKAKKGNAYLFELYERCLHWILRHARLCVMVFILIIPATILLFVAIDKQTLPEIDYTDGLMTIDWNSGISAQENDSRVLALLKGQHYIQTSTSMVGTQDFLLSHTPDITPSEALIYLKCASPSALKATCDSIHENILAHYPEATVKFEPAGNLLNMIYSSDEPDLMIRLQNGDGKRPGVDQAQAFTDTLRRKFPDISVPSVTTEENLQLVADVEKMSFYKISYSQLSQRLRELVGRNDVLRINRGASNVPVLLGADNDDRRIIMQSSVKSGDGIDVPLSYIITERIVNGYKHLYGNDGGEYYPVQINASSSEIGDIIQFVVNYDQKQEDVSTSMSGAYYSSRKLVGQLTGILAVSLLLLFFILAAQFESMVQPTIILSEMIIDVFLVVLGLWLFGETLNIMSMIGIIVMGGIVINDSILKIDTINRLRRAGTPLMKAILVAGHERLLPIIMTSLTTIFAMLPFMSKGSIGADMQYPLSLALIIGMAVGTLVSLFFVPMVYYIIYNRKS
ncbi:MAG: efflux RND transporter permease subunit [Prevotella sp.]|nr:efflux RND transporter permease subunit [Prevotella sp.]